MNDTKRSRELEERLNGIGKVLAEAFSGDHPRRLDWEHIVFAIKDKDAEIELLHGDLSTATANWNAACNELAEKDAEIERLEAVVERVGPYMHHKSGCAWAGKPKVRATDDALAVRADCDCGYDELRAVIEENG